MDDRAWYNESRHGVSPIIVKESSQVEVTKDVTKPVVQNRVLAVDIYSLIGLVAGTLRFAGQDQQEKEFVHRSIPMSTFQEVFDLSEEYVNWNQGSEECQPT